MAVRIEILTKVAEIRQILPDWKQLHSHVGISPFSSAEWIDAWLTAWPDSKRRPVFLCMWHDDRLVAGWPLCPCHERVIRHGPRLPSLRPLCDDKAGFHEVLVHPDAMADIPSMLSALRDATAWRVLDLRPMWPTPAFEAVMESARSQELRVRLREEIRTSLVDVRKGWDSYLQTRSRNFRKSLRTGQRKRETSSHRSFAERAPGVTALAVLMLLLASRRSGERAGRPAQRLRAVENANDLRGRMRGASARCPRSRSELAERICDRKVLP